MTLRQQLPTFLVIGAQRSGTTWLHTVLRQHPEIFLSERKELSYFIIRMLHHDLDHYTSFFTPHDGETVRPVRGDISPSYSMLRRRSVENIRKLLGDVQLVLTIRHPIERAFSQAMLRYGLRRKKKLVEVPVAKFLVLMETPKVTRFTDYLWMLDNWQHAFDPGALHVDTYDRLATDPAGYLTDILRHIGADASWSPPADLLQTPVWQSQRIEMPEIVRWYLARQWRQPVQRLNDRLDGRISHWLDAFDQVGPARWTWRIYRQLNRLVLAMPARMAYAAYYETREWRLLRRWPIILRQAQQARQ